MLLDFVWHTGNGGEYLVTDHQFAVVERMLIHIVRWQLDFVEVVLAHVFVRHGTRVVRRHIGNGEEEGFAGFLLFFDIFDGIFGKDIYRAFAGEHIFAFFIRNDIAFCPIFYDRTFIAIIAIGIVVIERYVPMVPHATEVDAFTIIEATVHCLVAVMPFAGMEGIITGLLQCFTNQFMVFRNGCPLLFQGVEIFTGHQHGTARHTDGAGGSAHDMSVRKDGTFGSQFIQIGSVYVLDTQEIHCCSAHVIRQYQDDIGILVGGKQAGC